MAPASEPSVTDKETSGCPTCGAAVAAASRFCPGCGREFSTLVPGEILEGKYEILDKIGEGGMGEVFRARHVHLDEIRIIKVMKGAALGDATQQRRFAEEARLATLVRHPNVAALYDFARLPSGTCYMVWEFIDGTTVLQRLRAQGRMTVEEAVEIALQVLAGLSEIHRAGVVHRDISPDNIMIQQKDGRRVAKIIDLGIAKRVASDPLGMTGTGMFLGKLKYCSPEQAGALRPGESLDARSDLYSFGAVLYEMLSGRPLFESPTPEGYLVKHLQEPAPRLDVSALPPDAGPALAAIVARALQKDRSRRFSSAAEFAAALASIRPTTRTLPTMIAPGATGEQTQLLATGQTTHLSRGPRKAILAAAAAAAAIGVFAIGYARWRASQNAAQPPEASAPGPSPRTTASAAPAAQPPASSVPAPALPVETAPPSPPAPAPEPTPAVTEEAERAPARPRPRPQPSAPADAGPPPERAEPSEIRPAERYAFLKSQAGRSPEAGRKLAGFANNYVEKHPDTPLARQIREELPAAIKKAALHQEALDHPFKAIKAFELYETLNFAPPDPEVDSHLAALRQETERQGRFRRR